MKQEFVPDWRATCQDIRLQKSNKAMGAAPVLQRGRRKKATALIFFV